MRVWPGRPYPLGVIAEPWDLGSGGYDVGNFPVNWSEWNGRYRDSVRRFWRGEPQQVTEIATRLAGSSDLYAHDARRPAASVNFVCVHDGFTLRDLVSYERISAGLSRLLPESRARLRRRERRDQAAAGSSPAHASATALACR